MKGFLSRKSYRFTTLGVLLLCAGLAGSLFGIDETVRLVGSCLSGLGIGWLIAGVGWSILT